MMEEERKRRRKEKSVWEDAQHSVHASRRSMTVGILGP